MNRLLVVSSSPHLTVPEDVPQIMYRVVVALLPVIAAGIYYFGIPAILLLSVCIVFSLGSEHLIQLLRKKSTTILDGSALVTGILLALVLPPAFPLWGAALGAVVAVVIGKMIFGGLGYNIFNPALVGRAFLQATFPVWITSWSPPVRGGFGTRIAITTQATPLAAMKFQHQASPYLNLFMGNIAGSLGETSALAILLGGAYLLVKKYADWRIVTAIFLSVTIFAGGLWLFNSEKFPDPMFHFFSGGFMLGTFFMATDMVTSPVTPGGRWLFGIGVGSLTVLIRSFGGLPEGIMYSILLMNALSPLIDRYTRPKIFGERVEKPGCPHET